MGNPTHTRSISQAQLKVIDGLFDLWGDARKGWVPPGPFYGVLLHTEHFTLSLRKNKPVASRSTECFEMQSHTSQEGKYYLQITIPVESWLYWLLGNAHGKGKVIPQNRTLSLHRLVAYLYKLPDLAVIPGNQHIHHININSLDCRINNLIQVDGRAHNLFHRDLSRRFPELAEPAIAAPNRAFLEVAYGAPYNRRAWVLKALREDAGLTDARCADARKILAFVDSVGSEVVETKAILSYARPQKIARRTAENLLATLVSVGLLGGDGKGKYWLPS